VTIIFQANAVELSFQKWEDKYHDSLAYPLEGLTQNYWIIGSWWNILRKPCWIVPPS